MRVYAKTWYCKW